MALWSFVSHTEAGSVVFAKPLEVWQAFVNKVGDGTLWPHIKFSLFRVIAGFGIAFVVSIPVAFLMAWYEPFRNLVEPWIQFIRNIPPLAYIPLVVLGAGIGEKSKIIVIFIAAFLTLVVTIYQGVNNVDQTMIKAARVLGATERDIFFKIIIPASTPFILVGTRLGLSASLTTLIAAELTGASKGLGMMTRQASSTFEINITLLGIILIGIIGLTFEKIVKFLERKLTGWQETVN
ncbi:MAG: ABC transporter permease [Tissierellia bacterium]|nr:ABC transporter permease [Tissierellia bacterium]